MQHRINCPNCDQHIVIDVAPPSPKEPLRVTMDLWACFQLTVGILLSLAAIAIVLSIGFAIFTYALQ
jgi:hypothetical protein